MNDDQYNSRQLVKQAQAYLGSQQLEDALNALREALSLDGENTDAMLLLSNIFYATNQHDLAAELLENALEVNPNLPSQTWNNLGHLYLQLGKHEKAIATSRRALELDPENSSALFTLGSGYHENQEFQKAIECLDHASKLSPDRMDILLTLASALGDAGQHARAIKHYQAILKKEPEQESAEIGLALARINNKDYKKGIKALKQCLKRDPSPAPLWFHLGTTLAKIGKLGKAVDALKEGLRLDPTIPKAWMDLHDVYKEMGEDNLASNALEKAMATGKVDVKFIGNEQEAMELLDELEGMKKGESIKKKNLRRVLNAWEMDVPQEFTEKPEGRGVQLLSPDGERCITASTLSMQGSIPQGFLSSISKQYEEAGLKFHSEFQNGQASGIILENDQYLGEDIFVLQSIIATPSRVLMLTFSIPDADEDKAWAHQVIRSIRPS